MLKEHAITYSEKLSIEQLEYIIKKSNSLGKKGRKVVVVFEETDHEGTHIYFEVTPMHPGSCNGR